VCVRTRGGVQKHAWRGASLQTESVVLTVLIHKQANLAMETKPCVVAEPVVAILTVLIHKQAKFSYN